MSVKDFFIYVNLCDTTCTILKEYAFYEIILCFHYRVVCVGGDGMFSELLNGLCERKLKDAGQEQSQEQNPIPPDIRIGIIPAGNVGHSNS